MNQIKGCLRQTVCSYVVATDLPMGSRQRFQKPGIKVGRQYMAGGADTVCEPFGDGSAPTSNFKATPTATDSEILQVPNGSTVVDRGKSCKSRSRLLATVDEDIAGATGLDAPHLPLLAADDSEAALVSLSNWLDLGT